MYRYVPTYINIYACERACVCVWGGGGGGGGCTRFSHTSVPCTGERIESTESRYCMLYISCHNLR